MVKWLHLHRTEGYASKVMDDAAANGHLDMVLSGCMITEMKAAHLERWRSYKRTSRSCPVAAWESARRLFRASAIESAASGGLLEIVQWLTKESKACITDAMEGAAGNGYLHVMKWLHMNRNEGCTTGGQWIKRRSSAPWKSCNGYMSTEQRVAPMLRWMEQRGVGTFSLFSGFWRSANLARKSLCWARS